MKKKVTKKKAAKKGDYKPTPKAQIKRRITRIVVSDGSEHCEATIDDSPIVGKPGKIIGWYVEDATTKCAKGQRWFVELVFDFPWNNGKNKKVQINPDDVETVKVHKNTPPTLPNAALAYKVWQKFPDGGDPVLLIDPELEIAP